MFGGGLVHNESNFTSNIESGLQIANSGKHSLLKDLDDIDGMTINTGVTNTANVHAEWRDCSLLANVNLSELSNGQHDMPLCLMLSGKINVWD